MKKSHSSKVDFQERAVLAGMVQDSRAVHLVEEHLDELEFLAQTAGAKTVERFVQRLDTPSPKTFLGKGKITEIQKFVEENNIDLVIFDDELTPTQLRNIERIMKVKVLDRSNLILDIFAIRARTSYAKTQVELAQYEYLLPRLTNMWTHLSKQKGGIGMKGPGETEIETDRRIIRDKIARLKRKLHAIDKQNATQRKGRGALVRVALIGYTNVGKSTLMNLLSKSHVFAENKLFATLDTTVRKVVIKDIPFLLSDTVGFIRKLPHQLVESFKSTLDEVREADLLVHVVDISHPNFEDHIQTVNQTLLEIGAEGKPTLLIFNKIDAYKAETETTQNGVVPKVMLAELKKTWMAKLNSSDVLFISAAKRKNIEELRKSLYEKVSAIHMKRYPHQTLPYLRSK